MKPLQHVIQTDQIQQRPTGTTNEAITARSGGITMALRGGEARALLALIEAGARGCSASGHSEQRLPAQVYLLRRRGLIIETITENLVGNFPGLRARYVLRSIVEILWRTPPR